MVLSADRGARRYAEIHFPVSALVTPDDPNATSYLTELIGHQLRYSMPSRRRAGQAVAWAARRSWLAGAATATQSHGRRVRSDTIDAAVGPYEVTGVLTLRRARSQLVFLFNGAAHPFVVLKIAPDPTPLLREQHALDAAAPARATPRSRGRRGNIFAQDGVPGTPPALEPIGPRNAARLSWTTAFDSLAGGLTRIGTATARHRMPTDLRPDLDVALRELPVREQRLLSAAIRAAFRHSISVLCHGDLSGQNWLVDEQDQLTGIVDWELCRVGLPGFDILHAATSWFEQGVALRRWTDDELLDVFAQAWTTSPFFAQARLAATAAAEAVGGVGGAQIETLFFARRFARRLQRDGDAVGPQAARRMLEVVMC